MCACIWIVIYVWLFKTFLFHVGTPFAYRTQSQIGFLSFVVLDQFRALADLVPGAEELVVQGEKNLEDWQSAMDILREAERRDA